MASPVSILLSGAGLAIVRLVAGVVRAKWIASTFGLPGTGLAAQATQFQLVAGAAASFSTSAALIQGAKGLYRERSEELFRCTFFLLLVGAGALLITCTAFGFANLGTWLFGPGYGAGDFALILLAVPFTMLSSCFLEAAFFARDRFDRYAVTSAIHAVAQSGAFVACSWAFGAKGILLAFPISSAMLLVLFSGDLLRMRELHPRWFLPRWNRELARFLVGHGTVMFATGVGGGFLLLYARSELVQRTGLEGSGVLQVPIALSAYGSAIMTNFLWGRVHPHFSAGGKHDSFELSLCTITSFSVALGTWAVAPILVPLIYAKDFSYAVPLVGVQSVGDIYHYSFFALAVAMLASGRFVAYVLGWVAYYLPYALLLVLPGHLHPHAFVSLHLAGSAFALIVVSLASLRNGPLLGRHPWYLVGFTLGLSALGAGAVFLTPASVVLQALTATIAVVLGLLLWRMIYGPIVDQQVVLGIHWIQRRLRLRKT